MAKFGLIVRPGIEKAEALGRDVITWCHKNGHSIVAEAQTAPLVGLERGVSPEELVTISDPIVSLGGDGTLIGVGRYVGASNPLLVGVNFGNLGFLTEVHPDELFSVLQAVGAGTVGIGTRHLLYFRVVRNGKQVFESQAVNDVVIQKSTPSPLINLDLAVDKEAVARLRCDGIIMASTTGSTAYSLAAGGSIVHPAVAALLLTPICPHSLTSRPLIVDLEAQITVGVAAVEGAQVFAIIDGQEHVDLKSNDVVELTRSKYVVRFVTSPRKSYFEILRTKLNWGIANNRDE